MPNNGMHPTRDTNAFIYLQRCGRAGDAGRQVATCSGGGKNMSLRFRRALASALAAACLLLTCSGGGAETQEKTAGAGGDDAVYTSSKVDVKAVVKLSEYDIPSGEGCKERRGLALLRAILRKTGEVTDVEIRQKSGCEEFDRRAVKAVKKIKFTPAKKGGVPVSQYHMHQFTYKIW
jgi:TonB family protein